MADYCTTAEAKALMTVDSGLASSTDYDNLIGTIITAASRAIDREIGRQANYFSPSSVGETRYYDGTGTDCLWIDDAVSITSVSVSESGGLASSDYTLWSSSDYITYPYNSTPIMKLKVDTLNGSKLYFDRYRKAVKVVGVFGYSATPPNNVNMACRIQSVRWFQRGKQMFADTGANVDVGQVTINMGGGAFIGSKLDPDVAALLNPYKLANV